MSIRITIKGNDWSEIRLQLADALETVRRQEAPTTAATPLEVVPPQETTWDGMETLPEAAARVLDAKPADKPTCPVHHAEMRFKLAGTSKAGKPFDAFYSCPIKDGDVWCKQTRAA